MSSADQHTGKITDGSNTLYRCYAATQEARNVHIRKKRWSNYLQLKQAGSVEQMNALLYDSLMPKYDKYYENHSQYPIVRAHIGGEFFNKHYFEAWLELATQLPYKVYAYTKAIPLWSHYHSDIPDNFELNGSLGGKYDNELVSGDFKTAMVVYSPEEAVELGLEIDHDDSHAYNKGPSFALLLHGTQPAGSEASLAKSALQKRGWNGYGKSHSTAWKSIKKKNPAIL